MAKADTATAKPVVVMFGAEDPQISGALAELARGFIEARLVKIDHFTQTNDAADAIGSALGGTGPSHLVGIAHGRGSTALIALVAGGRAAFTHAIALHPTLDGAAGPSVELDNVKMLISSGATDPQTPPDRVGTLIDALDGAGATTQIIWTRGGSDITEDEIEKATTFINALRSSLVDLRALPVRQIDEGAKGRYVIEAPGDAVAEMSYSRANAHLIIIDHTEVPEAFRGTGTGMRLLERLIADARANDTRIIPICPFAAAQFDRHPEWADVLEQGVKVKTRSGA